MANEIFMPPDDTYEVMHKKCQCGDELPTVTTEDNGKVLTVIDGSWGVGEASGASGMVVNATRGENEITLDKNYNEIKTALLSGTFTYVLINFSDGSDDSYNFVNIRGASISDGVYYIDLADDSQFSSDSATGILSMSVH